MAMGISLVTDLTHMTHTDKYDVAIVGAGLAGLALSIQIVRNGKKVVLIEKEKFPFHKVCGEYISMESWDFLISLGVPLEQMNVPVIDRLCVSAQNGSSLSTTLPLGGFGISRFALDSMLAEIAKREGVMLLEGTKVEDVIWQNDSFNIRCKGEVDITLMATVCTGAFGKRSNLDIKWKRSFLASRDKRLHNYVGIKYHVLSIAEANTITLHNFKDGYCGFSKIDGNKWCLCYMTTANNLKACGNDISRLEREILGKNPKLRQLLSECEALPHFPITISQINFSKKLPVEKGILMLGDAAGTISPLCGNGMSMALHSAKIAASLLNDFLNGNRSRQEMEREYIRQWHHHFSSRLKVGRMLQRFFGHPRLSNVLIYICKLFPFLIKPLIQKTHGRPY